MVAAASKCRTCRQPAVIDLPRHNAHFCAEHFLELCRRQVVKAIERFDMIAPDDRVLVAVSGGKDSLAVWDLLVELGYSADGLYIGLGIGEYSDVAFAHPQRRQSDDFETEPVEQVRAEPSGGGHGGQAAAAAGARRG